MLEHRVSLQALSDGITIIVNKRRAQEYQSDSVDSKAQAAVAPMANAADDDVSKVAEQLGKQLTTAVESTSSADAAECANAHLLAELPTGDNTATVRCISWKISESIGTVRCNTHCAIRNQCF